MMRLSPVFIIFFFFMVLGEIFALHATVWAIFFIPLFAVIDLTFLFIVFITLYADYRTTRKEIK